MLSRSNRSLTPLARHCVLFAVIAKRMWTAHFGWKSSSWRFRLTVPQEAHSGGFLVNLPLVDFFLLRRSLTQCFAISFSLWSPIGSCSTPLSSWVCPLVMPMSNTVVGACRSGSKDQRCSQTRTDTLNALTAFFIRSTPESNLSQSCRLVVTWWQRYVITKNTKKINATFRSETDTLMDPRTFPGYAKHPNNTPSWICDSGMKEHIWLVLVLNCLPSVVCSCSILKSLILDAEYRSSAWAYMSSEAAV